jgi:arylsulfatase A-like enzyme
LQKIANDGSSTLTADESSLRARASLWGRWIHHVLLVFGASCVLAALDVALTGSAEQATWSWSIGVAMGATLAPAIGALQLGVLLLARRATRGRLASWWARLRAASQQRTWVVRLHGVALSSALFVAVVLGGVWVVGVRLQAVQNATMQNVLLVVAVGGLLLAGALVAASAFPFIERLASRVDQRVGLPWPHSPLGRYACYVLGPTLLLAVPLLRLYGDDLSSVLPPVSLLLLLEFEIAIALLAHRFRSPRPYWSWAALGAWMVVVLCASPALGASQYARLAATRGLFTPRALSLVRWLSDVDRDGYSGWYAGGDCASFNRAVNPAARDVPANGKDENCDGDDAKTGKQHRNNGRGNLFSGTLEADQVRKYNVIWIVVDAIRADSMGLYGYERANTPMLNKFASSALVFENAVAPSATTHLSVPSMLIGMNVERMSWEYRKDNTRLEPGDDHRTLAQRLKAHGYRTAAIISPHMGRLPGITRGFDEIINLGKYRGRSTTDGPISTGLAIDESHGKQPYFLLVYYEDPHMPYEKHGKPFNFGKTDKDRYDGEIAYVDHYFGELIEHLKLHPKSWKETIVIFTSDHGEEFKERGSTGHGKSCYAESAHVPLVMRIPGVEAARVDAQVGLVDVVPTLLELIGIPEDRELDGRSLLHAARGGESPPVFCAILNQGTVAKNKPFYQRSVRFEGRHLLHKVLTDEYELYDLQDATDQENLVHDARETQTLEQLKELLQSNVTGNLVEKQLYH